MMKFFRAFFILSVLTVFVLSIGAQEIVTADKYMEEISNIYAEINDYEAQISIISGTTQMDGSLSFKNPNLLRIDFSNPAEQVVLYDGKALTVYLPAYRVVLNQNAPAQGASLASN
ncbi:MAG: outer-membrane lipoprotein carrier protein LolA, partial [Spirochaetaceae bacterium]|nr:outer-membrane lipoprotein carrier protein LolA [Spirochaetaceae bacterium]